MAKIRGGDNFLVKLREIQKKMERGAHVQVGFIDNATYPDGTSVAEVAFYNEFGHKARDGSFVGPWPFFRYAVKSNQEQWPKTFQAVLKSTNYDLKKSLGRMGEVIVGQVKKSIRDIQVPALKPSTIAAKGFSKPMIATRQMLNSVTYKVNLE